jgi:D-aspartate ligase
MQLAGGSAARTAAAGRVPAVVLKTGAYLADHHGTAIARTLGRIGVTVYGAADSRRAPMAASRYTTRTFVWRSADLSASSILECLADVGRALGRTAVLIPIDDVGAVLIAENAATLREHFLFPDVPPDLPRRVANKRELYALCERLAVPHPRSIFPRSLAEVEQFVGRAAFPVVAKAAEAWCLPAGLPRTLIADNPEQLIEHYRCSVGHERAPNLLLQEYIPEPDGEDWIFHGYCDAGATCPLQFTGRKIRSYPAFAGITSLGRSVANPHLARQAAALLRDLSYHGIVDLDYRLDRRDGQYKLLDFNPRTGAQFRLFESESGLDVVRALYLDLTGEAVRPSRQRDDRVFVLEPHDIVSGAHYFNAGKLTIRGWCATLRGKREWAWLAWDDLLPFIAMVLRLGIRALDRCLHWPARAGRRRVLSGRWLRRLPSGSAKGTQY